LNFQYLYILFLKYFVHIEIGQKIDIAGQKSKNWPKLRRYCFGVLQSGGFCAMLDSIQSLPRDQRVARKKFLQDFPTARHKIRYLISLLSTLEKK